MVTRSPEAKTQARWLMESGAGLVGADYVRKPAPIYCELENGMDNKI